MPKWMLIVDFVIRMIKLVFGEYKKEQENNDETKR